MAFDLGEVGNYMAESTDAFRRRDEGITDDIKREISEIWEAIKRIEKLLEVAERAPRALENFAREIQGK